MSVEQFLQFSDLLPMPMVLVAADGTILAANQAMEGRLGLVPAEITGRLLSDIVADVPEKLTDYLRICSRSRTLLPGSLTLLGKLGQRTACRCEGAVFQPSANGEPARILLRFVTKEVALGQFRLLAEKVEALNRQIARRQQTEMALRKQNERLRLLGEVATNLLSAQSADSMVRQVFEQIESHFQLDVYFSYFVNDSGDALSLESCTGISLEDAAAVHRLEFGDAICGTVAIQRQPIVATMVQNSDDPRADIVRRLGIQAYACFPMVASDRLLGTLSFASRSRDQFDEEELEFFQTVSHYATVAYQRLQLIRQLKEADRRKDEFLATLAHELRNPLAPIRNAVELMRRAGSDSTIIDQARGLIERQLRRMVRLIDDLLEVSRITRGKLILRKERVELAAVVQSAAEATSPLMEAQGHQLIIELPPEPLYVNCDPTRIAQVFANVLENAAKYTEKGGHVYLLAERQGHQVSVSVRDTGIGIPAEHLPRIFEMFSQVAPALERSQGGLGIGLSLAKGLVELHGGTIEAHSNGPGLGSEFTVRLPVDDPLRNRDEGADASDKTKMAAGEDQRRESHHASKRRILVVDDNSDAADSLAMMLRMMGYESQTAQDGIEAVHAAAVFRPTAVLLDMGLPKMNGYEACKHIREQVWGRQMFIIAVTGWGQDEDKRRALDAGCDYHLTKPVDPTALEKLLSLLPATTA